jgi:hypothetical protein
MKIKPKLSYSMSGYGQLNKDKIYSAIDATNQDNWKKEGKIFVQPNNDLPIEMFLKRGEYEVISTDHLPEDDKDNYATETLQFTQDEPCQ